MSKIFFFLHYGSILILTNMPDRERKHLYCWNFRVIESLPEVESSRTSLASKTHFKVLGLGLEGQVLGLGIEASSPRKLPCPPFEDSTIF